jgi:hypothetical protein
MREQTTQPTTTKHRGIPLATSPAMNGEEAKHRAPKPRHDRGGDFGRPLP